MLEQSYVKFGTLTTRTYEVTFSAGTLGINLLATRAGFGGYVDTFYRPPEGSILYAEQSGLIKRGDLILEINGEDVSRIQLSELPKRIEKAKRPIVVKFESVSMGLTFPDVVSDPRKMPWFMQYLVETYGVEEAVTEQAKLMLWLECEAYHENVHSIPEGDYSDQELLIFKKFFREQSNFSLLYHIPDNLRHLIFAALSALGIETSHSRSNQSSNTSSGGAQASPNSVLLMNHFSSRKGFGSQLLLDAQRWVEEDMSKGSFKYFLTSEAAARMIGYLRYSPPFVKMSLMDVLKCDRKSMYFVVFLCQIKRHAAIHCNNILRPRPDDYPEGTVGHAEDVLRKAVACVHVLGLQEGRAGIEDLPMLKQLKQMIPDVVELPGILYTPASTDGFPAQTGKSNVSVADPYIDILNSAISLSVPLSNELRALARDSLKKVLDIKHKLQELRIAILRELSSELMPKFLASKEFEVLLWEIEAHRQFQATEKANAVSNLAKEPSEETGSNYVDSEGESEGRSEGSSNRYNDEDSASLGSLGTIGEEDSKDNGAGVVPDGAVQRLLRKVSLPGTMTMHRAPLSLLDEAREEVRRKDCDATAWLVVLDTHGAELKTKSDRASAREREKNIPRASNITTRDVFHDSPAPSVPVIQELKVDFILPIGQDRGSCLSLDSSIIPPTLPNFIIPSGKFVWDSSDRSTPPPPRLSNLVVSTRDNMPLYVASLTMYRPLSEADMKVTESVTRNEGKPGHRHGANTSGQSNFNTPIKSAENGATESPSTFRTPSSKSFSAQNGGSSEGFYGANISMSQSLKSMPKLNTLSEYNGAKINMLLGLGDKDNPPRPLLGRMNGALSPIVMRGKALVGGVLRSRNSDPDASSAGLAVAVVSSTSSTALATLDSSQSTVLTTDSTSSSKENSSTGDGDAKVDPDSDSAEKTNTGDKISQESGVDQEGGTNTPDSVGAGSQNKSSDPGDPSSRPDSAETLPSVSSSTSTGIAMETPHKRSLSGSGIISQMQQMGFDQLPFSSPLEFMRRNNSGKEQPPQPDDDSSPLVSGKNRDHVKENSNVARDGKDRERRVPYSLCLVTKTPCIDALRLPLAMISKYAEIRVGEPSAHASGSFESNRSSSPAPSLALSTPKKDSSNIMLSNNNNNNSLMRNTSSSSADASDIADSSSERRALIALALMEGEDSLRLLRQAASSFPRFTIPTILRPDGAHDMDMEMIFRALNPRNIVTIFLAFILEFKIAVVSSRMTSLTVLGELLKTMISPLRWSHIYVPVLPKNMSTELLQCPTPFFVGLLRENFDTSNVPSDVCLVDLENDACRVPSSLSKALSAGRRLARSLDELMRPALFRCDDVEPLGGTIPTPTPSDTLPSSSVTGINNFASRSNGNLTVARQGGALIRDILRHIKAFMADVLEGIDECSVHCIDHSEVVVLFDEAMFCTHKAQRSKYSEFPADRVFLEHLMRTQCFSMCVGGSILKRLDPHSRPPSRPSSPFLAMAPLHDQHPHEITNQQYL